MSRRLRRRERKAMSEFTRDHCWGWRPPMKLRRIRRYTPAEIEVLLALRTTDQEAGRKRMIARGRRQYAHPGELCCGGDPAANHGQLECVSVPDGWVRICPHCRVVISVPTGKGGVTSCRVGDKWVQPAGL